MLSRDLYQASAYCDKTKYTGPTLADNDDEWLGKGYYFWDNNIDDAHWWGNIHYSGSYIITKSAYDYHSTEYLDLVSLREHKEYIQKACFYLEKRAKKLGREEKITIGKVIEILKKSDRNFKFKAIRACPVPIKSKRISFDTDGQCLMFPNAKYQICVIDKVFLIEEPYCIFQKY